MFLRVHVWVRVSEESLQKFVLLPCAYQDRQAARLGGKRLYLLSPLVQLT